MMAWTSRRTNKALIRCRIILASLLNLALTGDLVGVEELAVRFAEREASWGPFAQRLQQLAADMEDEQIITFIKQYMSKDT
ncbi:MAG: hypothetical protein JXM69_21880 [Anaerolineae bacterium]|nr:hypothetical protein [Anaerolineae bacterium]